MVKDLGLAEEVFLRGQGNTGRSCGELLLHGVLERTQQAHCSWRVGRSDPAMVPVRH